MVIEILQPPMREVRDDFFSKMIAQDHTPFDRHMMVWYNKTSIILSPRDRQPVIKFERL